MAKRYSQPQGGAQIDWRNPITRGLVLASNHDTDIVNIAGSTGAPTLIGSPTGVVFSEGTAVNFVATSSQGIDYGNSATLNPTSFTLFSLFQINSVISTVIGSGNEYVLISRDDASLGRAYCLTLNGGNNWGIRAFINGGVAGGVIFEGVQPSVGVPHTAAFSYSGGVENLYRDGIRLTGATGLPAVASTTGPTQVGIRSYSGSRSPMNGYISLSLIYNRALSDAEVKSLSNNPWQIFTPISSPIWVTSTSGATGASISTVDSADIQNTTAIVPVITSITTVDSADISSTSSSFGSTTIIPIINSANKFTQPQGRVTLNKLHPLYKYLISAYVGNSLKDLVSGQSLVLQSGAKLAASTKGIGLNGSTITSGAYCTQKLLPTNEAAIFWNGFIPPTSTGDATLAGITYNSTNSNPYVCVELKRFGTNKVTLTFGAGASSYYTTSAGTPSGNMSISGSVLSGYQTLYLDGIPSTVTSTTFASLASTGTSRFEINDSLNSRQSGAVCNVCYIFSKAISSEWHSSLSSNPWQLFSSTTTPLSLLVSSQPLVATISTIDAIDIQVVVLDNWTIGQLVSSDTVDITQVSVSAGSITLSSISTLDSIDIQQVAGTNWTLSQVVALDTKDLTNIQGAIGSIALGSISQLDTSDSNISTLANWTVSQILGTDSQDLSSMLTTAGSITLGSVYNIDSVDISSSILANWTIGQVNTSDIKDTSSVLGYIIGALSVSIASLDTSDQTIVYSVVTIGGSISTTDTLDLSSINTANWTTSALTSIDGQDKVFFIGGAPMQDTPITVVGIIVVISSKDNASNIITDTRTGNLVTELVSNGTIISSINSTYFIQG
jgi:hypothetical protein